MLARGQQLSYGDYVQGIHQLSPEELAEEVEADPHSAERLAGIYLTRSGNGSDRPVEVSRGSRACCP